MNTAAGLEARFLDLTEEALASAGRATDPLAALVLIHALDRVRLRDTFIASLLGEPAAARAILQGRPAQFDFTRAHPGHAQLQNAHQLLDELVHLARSHDPRLMDPLLSIRALLHWTDSRPTEALANLGQVSPTYSLAQALRRVLLLPRQHEDHS